jgi:hypothetical protein
LALQQFSHGANTPQYKEEENYPVRDFRHLTLHLIAEITKIRGTIWVEHVTHIR